MISLYHTERVKVNILMNVYKKIKALTFHIFSLKIVYSP